MKRLNDLDYVNLNLSDKLLSESLSDDETRPFLQGVFFHEDGYKVSCDGHRLFRTTFGYVEELKGKILDPKSVTLIDRTFPKTSSVIPTRHKDKLIKVTFKRNQFKSYKRRPVKVYIVKDGDGHILSDNPENSIACFNYRYLKDLHGELNVYYGSQLSPVLIEIDKFSDYTVMPMRY